MLILGTGWEIQELDSDLWEIWPRASVLTLKYNLHPSGLSTHEKKEFAARTVLQRTLAAREIYQKHL